MYPIEPAAPADFLPGSNAHPVRWTTPGTLPEPIDHLRLDGVEFRPVGELRLVTERSVWLLRADTYYRMPKEEQAREQDWSIEGRMDDGRSHSYRRAWFWIYDHTWLRARILPSVGPVHGIGIYTGCILAISGTWEEVESDPERPETNGTEQ